MADWLLLLLLAALGAGGYWLMGRVGRFLAGNLARGAAPAQPVTGWTPAVLCDIMGKTCAKEGLAHGTGGQSTDTPHGCAG